MGISVGKLNVRLAHIMLGVAGCAVVAIAASHAIKPAEDFTKLKGADLCRAQYNAAARASTLLPAAGLANVTYDETSQGPVCSANNGAQSWSPKGNSWALLGQ